MTRTTSTEATDKLLPRLTLLFFKRTWLTAFLWISLLIFGVFSYTTFLKREGFPSINIPVVVVNGVYLGEAANVDTSLAKPISEIALKQKGVSSVRVNSQDNFMTATVMYEESVEPNGAQSALKSAIAKAANVPEGAELTYAAPYFGSTGGSVKKIDATISLYDSETSRSTAELSEIAAKAVDYLNQHKGDQIAQYFQQSPYAAVSGEGQATTVQRNFDRYTSNVDGKVQTSNAVIIGVTGVENADVIKLDSQVEHALSQLQNQSEFKTIDTAISSSFAPNIEDNISELQKVLLEGLIAVLVIGSLVIAVRASLITVIAMISVLAISIGLLFVTGYSLNVITLFALILGLSLIVDDTIIMIEAIDAARRRHTTAKAVVRDASQKISRAMVAATLTAAFSFVPLLFVSGTLGSFIRAIPFTIISSLLISLLVALLFIPLFARYILLGKKQLGEDGQVLEPAAGLEHRIADFIGKPMLWSKGSRARQFGIGAGAFIVSIAFVVAAGILFTKVTFNIFPNSKDSNQIAVTINYPTGTTISEAETIADTVNKTVATVVGADLESGSYYGMGSAQSATFNITLIPYSERDTTAPSFVERINEELKGTVPAQIEAYQVDVGPPSSGFNVLIAATDRQAARELATDVAAFLKTRTLTRPSGEKATLIDVAVGNTDTFNRIDGVPTVSVTARFEDNDTSTLTALAQSAVTDEFTDEKIARYGLSAGDVTFDIGQESENQDSFASLALAFPIVLVAIFILLAVQFRSLLQPLLIFMALPFSLFGVALGLFVTDNPISFFSLLGFFALIGLSIKNTILLTDYANQARRSGLGPIDSAVASIAERFRPLIATSLTAIVSLIPLALSSPFWEGLAYTLIFGLASSTILVILVFPYYYLAGEYFRQLGSRLYSKLFRRHSA